MKPRTYTIPLLAAAISAVSFTSCNWTGGSDSDFNTSRGSLNINISGVYTGVLGGGRAVSQTSGGAITSLVVQQSGNVLEITDNNGQKYRGSAGSPLSLTSVEQGGTLPVGAQLATFQVNWSGKDGVAAKNINFTGVINLVSVTDIQGDSKVVTNTATDNSNTTSTNTRTAQNGSDGTVTINNSSTVTSGSDRTQVVATDPNGGTGTETDNSETINSTVSDLVNTNVRDNQTTVTTTNTRDRNNVATTTSQDTYILDNSNVQFRLRGTWIEDGGVVGQVDAVAPGAGGVLVVLNTGDDGGNTSTLDTVTGGNGGNAN